VQAEGDTVLDICLHTLEDLTSGLDGKDDSAQTGGEENDISSSLGSFRCTLDSDTAISLLERRSIVNA
jgi:hypothetical protein